AGHPELLGQAVLDEPLTGLQLAAHDHPVQLGSDRLTQRAVLGTDGHGWGPPDGGLMTRSVPAPTPPAGNRRPSPAAPARGLTPPPGRRAGRSPRPPRTAGRRVAASPGRGRG